MTFKSILALNQKTKSNSQIELAHCSIVKKKGLFATEKGLKTK